MMDIKTTELLLKVNPYIDYLVINKGFTEDEANDFVFALLDLGADCAFKMIKGKNEEL